MKSTIRLSIAQPCHQDWQKMTPLEKGRFCNSCQKNVYDFTTQSDKIILERLRSGENICGRFLGSQLDRDLIEAKEKSIVWMALATGILGFLSLGTQTALAQKGDVSIRTNILEVPRTQLHALNTPITISGIVRDSNGILAGVHILHRESGNVTESDVNGVFSISANGADTLIFSYPMMHDHVYVVKNEPNNDITVNMWSAVTPNVSSLSGILGGVSTIAYGVAKKRSFAGRIFYRIGNIFR